MVKKFWIALLSLRFCLPAKSSMFQRLDRQFLNFDQIHQKHCFLTASMINLNGIHFSEPRDS